MSLQTTQQQVDQWIKDYGVRYFNELTNMALLTEEVGELARIVARQYGEQSFKDSDREKNLADEMADVLFVLVCLANQTGINLQEAFDKKLDTGVIVRYNPGYQDHSSPTNLPYLADWPAYTLVDLYANFKFNDQFILRGSVENVADRAYVVSYADMQSNSLGRGRTFTFGVEYTF